MKVLVSWSGGKDSQACLIWAVEKYGLKNVEAVFCDTGWEHELTYRHVTFITEALGVKLTTLKSSKYDGFVDLAVKKKRMPSTRARFCTVELKVKPMIDYILSQKDNLLILQGIRADESVIRSEMLKECRYFKYYFEPYQTNSTVVARITQKSLIQKLTDNDKKKLNRAKSRLKKGKEDPKFHTYRKEEVIEWCINYSDDLLRPIIEWTAQETIMYSIDYGLPLNPLYYQGKSRVGCYPCIMCTKSEIADIVLNDPKTLLKIHQAETRSNSSFFRPDYVPVKYRRRISSKGKKYALINDVADYIRDKNATGNLFAELEKEEKKSEVRRCMSAYNICE
ncbi:phosphoadenosine phosphosulfate reductase family protein [Sphingobacterium spiritivorum]|uniref:phosphoadenosine phosphosulfate reductase family protein n=1 Tax=Sphingobacterium spiritivorum TaxID=258 RepID=UPI003DA6CD4C